MKFKSLGIEIKGYELYVDADCKLSETIKQIILEGHKALQEKKSKDSVPEQFRPKEGLGDIFNIFKK